MIVHEIPYLDTRDLNLDWLLRNQREMWEKIQDLQIEKGYANIVVVDDYGAVGDGETDSTDAIQRAIDENPCSTIFFKGGTYCVSSTIYPYAEGGGQLIMLGGAILKWTGAYNSSEPLISITKNHEDDELSSACRILGGNIDCNKRCGYGIECNGFYSVIDGTKIFNFVRAGLFVGALSGKYKSLQARFTDLLIYQTMGDYSAEDTAAIVIDNPDSEFSGIVTNRTRVGFELHCGGNSFVNCHYTAQFKGYDANPVIYPTKAIYDLTKAIYIKMDKYGTTQFNIFQGCYFNAGKYVVYSEIETRMNTNLDACAYVFYGSANWPYQMDAVICGGEPSDFRCSNFDCLVGGNCQILDYFPTSRPTSIIPLPDYIQINSNDRHPEEAIWSAFNLQPEHTLTPIISDSLYDDEHPSDPDLSIQLNTYYRVGAIMMAYDGTGTTSINTAPVRLRLYNSSGAGEWLIGFNGSGANLTPYIIDRMATAGINDAQIYLSTTPDMVTLEGVVYPTFYIYILKSNYLTLKEYLTIENDNPFVKCYIRNRVVLTDRTTPDNVFRLPYTGTVHKTLGVLGDSYAVQRVDTETSVTISGWVKYFADHYDTEDESVVNQSVGQYGFIGLNRAHAWINLVNAFPARSDYLIAGGYNDHWYTQAEIVTAGKACIDAIRALNPDARVWLAFIAHSTQDSVMQELFPVMSAYRQIARECDNVIFIDGTNYVLRNSDITGDSIHPTEAGCKKIANAIYTGMLGNNPSLSNSDIIPVYVQQNETVSVEIANSNSGLIVCKRATIAIMSVFDYWTEGVTDIVRQDANNRVTITHAANSRVITITNTASIALCCYVMGDGTRGFHS